VLISKDAPTLWAYEGGFAFWGSQTTSPPTFQSYFSVLYIKIRVQCHLKQSTKMFEGERGSPFMQR
jgi:hypothetical protein